MGRERLPCRVVTSSSEVLAQREPRQVTNSVQLSAVFVSKTASLALPLASAQLAESWETCARREVEEETGLVLDKVSFAHVNNNVMSDKLCGCGPPSSRKDCLCMLVLCSL